MGPTFLSQPGRAWCALSAVLLAGSLVAMGLPATALDWQPALAFTEPWRAWTAAFVHLSTMHVVGNFTGLALTAAFGWVSRVPPRAALAWFLAWPLTHWGLGLATPDLLHYAGLSGVVHAGVIIVIVHLLVHGERGPRLVAATVLAGLVTKIATETPWRGAVQQFEGWDIGIAPMAHVTGVASGLLCLFAIALWQRPPPAEGPPAGQERRTHLDTLAIVSLIACSFLWGLNQVAAKVALAEVSPLVQATVRSVGGVLLVMAWARWRGIALFRRDGTLFGGVLAGALFAAEFACIFIGLQYTTASRMIVFIYFSPFIVALGMPFIAKAEKLSALQTTGLVIAFAGVAGAFAEGFTAPAIGPQQWIGDALGVLASVLWAATTLAIRATRLGSAVAEKTLAYQLGVSGLLLGAAALMRHEHWPQHVSMLAVASLLFQMVIVVFASYLLWFWLVRHYPATRLAAFTLLTPLFGLLMGVVMLGEPVTARLLLALAGVTLGIALVNRAAKKT
jgi:rhomboid family GlyGly-CTERM serine protease